MPGVRWGACRARFYTRPGAQSMPRAVKKKPTSCIASSWATLAGPPSGESVRPAKNSGRGVKFSLLTMHVSCQSLPAACATRQGAAQGRWRAARCRSGAFSCATFVQTAPEVGVSGGAGSGGKPGAKKSLRPKREAGIDTRFKKLVLESTTPRYFQFPGQLFKSIKVNGLRNGDTKLQRKPVTQTSECALFWCDSHHCRALKGGLTGLPGGR